MSVIKWIHFSDLHLGNNRAVDTVLMRKALPDYIASLHQPFDYVFCTGDVKEWNAIYDETFVEYLISICKAAKTDKEHLFIVPGNHDVDISNPERNSIIEKLTDWSDTYYIPADGNISASDLFVLKEGEAGFISFISNLLGDERAEKYKEHHFVISAEHFNILHIDSTLSYGEQHDRDLIIGTKALMDALEDCDSKKPTIIITHYSFNYLAQDEQTQVERLLKTYDVRLWLAGHEHRNIIQRQRDFFYECLNGNLALQYGAKSCFLVGEYDTIQKKGIIKAHAWYQGSGWAEYPFVRIGTEDDKVYPFVLYDSKTCSIRDDDSLGGKLEKLAHGSKEGREQLRVPPSLTEIPIAIDLIGREQLIYQIKKMIDQNNVVYIHADGGVGKTAIATSICNSYKNSINDQDGSFKHVAWLTSTGNLKLDLASLSSPFITNADDLESRYKDVCQWLSMPENATFLVLDNMDSIPTVEERKILNTFSGSTKVLITSRAEIGDFYRVELNELDDDSALSLFYRHFLNNSTKPSLKELKKRSDISAAKEIVRATSNNALMIELLGKAAYSESRELPDYWQLLGESVFSKDSEIPLRNPHAESHGLDPESDDRLTMHEQIRRLYELSSISNQQRELMEFISTFPTGTKIYIRIPLWCGFSASDIHVLLQKGWIRKEDDNYSIHPLVKSSVELQVKKDDEFNEVRLYPTLMKELLSDSNYLPRDISYTKAKERISVPKALCDYLIEKGFPTLYILDFSHMVTHVLRTRVGDYDEALKYANIELTMVERILGLTNLYAARAYNDIAQIYDDQMDYPRAIEYYKKDAEICEKELESHDPMLAMRYNNLAWVYTQMNDYDNALCLFNRAHEILRESSKAESQEAAILFDNMALLFAKLGKYQRALQLHDKALSITIKEFGQNDLETATVYHNKGTTLSEIGQYIIAKENLEQSYSIRKSILGEEHPITLSTLMELQRVCYLQNYSEEDLYKPEVGRIACKGMKHILQMGYESIQDIDTVHQTTSGSNSISKPFVRIHKKIGRNEICPCGSGKKFKKCCLGKGIYD